jgi:hypothetical protein
MKILEKIAALIDVKSLTTLSLMITFVILSIKGVIPAEQFLQIFLVIITYYFTKDTQK